MKFSNLSFISSNNPPSRSNEPRNPVLWTKRDGLIELDSAELSVSCATIGSKVSLDFSLVQIFADGAQIRRPSGARPIHFQEGTIIEADVKYAGGNKKHLFRIMNLMKGQGGDTTDVDLKFVECRDSDREAWVDTMVWLTGSPPRP